MFRGILAAIGLANFGFGILSLVQPQLVAGWIGFELLGPSAFGEMRAMFGGVITVVGVLFIVAGVIARPAPLLGALGLVFGGLALGRATSVAVDGWSFYTALAFALEAPIAGVCVYLWSNPAALAGPPTSPADDAYEHSAK